MDPLVRATLVAQQGLHKGSGVAVDAGFGALLIAWACSPWPGQWSLALLAAYTLVLAHRTRKRLAKIAPRESTRIDLELFCLLLVGVYALLWHAPGGLTGPLFPLVYAVMMVVAGFTRPPAAIGCTLFAIGLEYALMRWASAESTADWLIHAGLIGLFSFLNLLLFQAEIARVRRLSRGKIEGEIAKMKEAARSYRLINAPGNATQRDSIAPAKNAEDRLLQSGVDEIHQAQQFALELLRRTLRLQTATLLWLTGNGEKLQIRELSSSVDSIAQGPFNAKDGVFAAALGQGHPIAVHGKRAARHASYYEHQAEVGSICAVPVLDHGQARGLLVVDRRGDGEFGPEEQELLVAATHFMLRSVENERVFVQLERAKLEQGKLYRAAESLASSTTEAQVVEAGVNSAREFAAFDFAVVTLFDRETTEHEICAVSGDRATELLGRRFRHNAGLVSMVVANRHPLPYRGDYDPGRQIVFTRRLAPPPMPSLLVLPLVVHERPLGTLVLGSKRRHAFGDAVRPTLEVLASHMAVSLSNARMLKRLEEMATTDGMTGLLNKRALLEAAEQKLKSARRFDKPLSVLVCDIDHFKRVNDTHGHDVGDHVIRGVAGVLRRVKRATDVVGRFGGEEFVLVCEHTDASGATLLAERIRSECAQERFPCQQGSVEITCSVGVATFPQAGNTWEALFKATDDALYSAKRGGRDRVVVWNGRPPGVAA